MCVVFDPELIGDGEHERVGGLDGSVGPQLINQDVGLGGVGTSKNCAGMGVDIAELIALLLTVPKVRPVTVRNDWEDTAADTDPGLSLPSSLSPGCSVGINLTTLLDMQWFPGFVENQG